MPLFAGHSQPQVVRKLLLESMGLAYPLLQQLLRFTLIHELPDLNPKQQAETIREHLASLHRMLLSEEASLSHPVRMAYVCLAQGLVLICTESLSLFQLTSPGKGGPAAMHLLRVEQVLHEQYRLLYQALDEGDRTRVSAPHTFSSHIRQLLRDYTVFPPTYAMPYGALLRTSACTETMSRILQHPTEQPFFPLTYV